MKPIYDPSGWFLYRGHLAMQNRLFPAVFDAFFEEVRPATVIELGSARGGFTYFLSEMRARFGFRLSAYDIREPEELAAIVSAERIPFTRLDGLGAEAFERISAEIRSEGVTVVFCDGGAKALEIERFGALLKHGDFILAHDYAPSPEYFEKEMRGRVWEWLEITDADVEEACSAFGLIPYEKDWFLRAAWLCLRRGPGIASRLGLRGEPAQPPPATAAEVREFIVRALAARHGSAARAALDAALSGRIDWESVLEMADGESLSALLFRALRDVRAVPRAVIARLRVRYRQSTARALVLLHALEEILAVLASQGIEPLALPGAGLDLVDHDVDLRCHNDFDLLMERAEVEAAAGILGSLGYEREIVSRASPSFESELTLCRRSGNAIRIVLRGHLPGSGDLETRTSPCWFGDPMNAFAQDATKQILGRDVHWQRWLCATARRISIGAATVRIPAPEAELLVLAALLGRCGDDLRWLDDFARLLAVHGERIDFSVVFRHASAWDLVEPLRNSLLTVDAHWGAPLPPGVRSQLDAL